MLKNMTKILPMRGVLLLALLLLLQLSIAVNTIDGFEYRPRRVRSSYYGPSTVIKSTAYQPVSYFSEPMWQSEPSSTQNPGTDSVIKTNILKIFFGNAYGYALSDGIPPITVRRSSDGKLSAVYKEYLLLQTPAPFAHTHQDQPPITTHHSETAGSLLRDNNDAKSHCGDDADSKTYCVDVTNYEEMTQLNKVSKEQFDKFNELFVVDVIEPEEIRIRMNDPEDIELCSSRSRVVYPKKAITKQNTWLYVVQSPEKRQGVLEETCENANSTCEFSEYFPKSYVARCKQYHAYRTLVSIDNGTLSKQEFVFGGSCKCVLRKA